MEVTAKTGVDHIMFRPSPRSMTGIYNASLKNDLYPIGALKRATSVCNSCIQVINTQLLNFASGYQIPIIAGGYLGGQIPSDSGIMKQNFNAGTKNRETINKKIGSYIDQSALHLFTQTTKFPKNEIYVINPMAYLNVSEEKIIESIKPLGWIRPSDTGQSSSNCLLNDYAIFQHIEKYGFHPYILEVATMVRRGTISRESGLSKVDEHISKANFKEIEKRLNQFNENTPSSWTR
jgi:hypothetical protein